MSSLSRARSASIMSSHATRLPGAVTRNSGAASTAQASDAQEAKIARFSLSVRSGSRTTSIGCANALAGCKRVSRLKTSFFAFVVSFMAIPPCLWVRRSVSRTTSTRSWPWIVVMRPWNARWCGLCRPSQRLCRSQSRSGAASLHQAVRVPVQSAASRPRVKRPSRRHSRQD